MSFTQSINQMHGLYEVFLESGSQDASALKLATLAAYEALDSLPPALAARMTPGQQQQAGNLTTSYRALTSSSQGWGHPQRQGWLEEARALLLAVR